jgi:nucleoside-diphosphate-sugar epimerase
LGGPLDWLAEAESRVLDAPRARGIVVRPPIVYGDGGGPVRRLVEQARADGVARYVDAGLNCWSVVHVRDLARAYALLVESSLSGVFHVAEEAPLRMVDLMTAVGRRAEVPVASWSLTDALASHGPMAGFLAMDAALDATRLREAVGWEPVIATALGGLQGGGSG